MLQRHWQEVLVQLLKHTPQSCLKYFACRCWLEFLYSNLSSSAASRHRSSLKMVRCMHEEGDVRNRSSEYIGPIHGDVSRVGMAKGSIRTASRMA